MQDNKEIGLYIHIPFCKSKCYYCDFNSYSGRESDIPAYFDALKKEIKLYSNKLKKHSIKTIFIGGGTPSFVDAHYIYETINLCKQYLDIKPDAEISIETNPGTLSYEKLTTYKVMGINRLSMGLQASQNSLLKKIGRIHTYEEFYENFLQARKVGFKNINIDIIFGLPGQTLKNWAETLKSVMELNPEHLSCYSLKIEDDSVFGKMKETGELKVFDDDIDRDMYYLTKESLTKEGLFHYEISNFAKPGFECRHNLIYWNAEEYIGVGAGAHSYFEGERYNNCIGIEEYVDLLKKDMLKKENIQEICKKEQISEYIILGLRLVKGIFSDEFKLRFDADMFSVLDNKIDSLIKRKLIEVDEKSIRLSSRGLDFANEVFMEFI